LKTQPETRAPSLLLWVNARLTWWRYWPALAAMLTGAAMVAGKVKAPDEQATYAFQKKGR
jgi:hypothetical protein